MGTTNLLDIHQIQGKSFAVHKDPGCLLIKAPQKPGYEHILCVEGDKRILCDVFDEYVACDVFEHYVLCRDINYISGNTMSVPLSAATEKEIQFIYKDLDGITDTEDCGYLKIVASDTNATIKTCVTADQSEKTFKFGELDTNGNYKVNDDGSSNYIQFTEPKTEKITIDGKVYTVTFISFNAARFTIDQIINLGFPEGALVGIDDIISEAVFTDNVPETVVYAIIEDIIGEIVVEDSVVNNKMASVVDELVSELVLEDTHVQVEAPTDLEVCSVDEIPAPQPSYFPPTNEQVSIHIHSANASVNDIIIDRSGKSVITNNSIIHQAPGSPGSNTSLYFDGSAHLYIDKPNAEGTIFDLGTDPWTIEFWINMDPGNLAADPGVVIMDMGDPLDGGLCLRSQSGSQQLSLQYTTWPGGIADPSQYTGSGASHTTNYTYADGSWHHIIYTRVNSTTIKVYANGNKIDEITIPEETIFTSKRTHNSGGGQYGMKIGRSFYPNPGALFTGYLNDIRVCKNHIAYIGDTVDYPSGLLPSSLPACSGFTNQYMFTLPGKAQVGSGYGTTITPSIDIRGVSCWFLPEIDISSDVDNGVLVGIQNYGGIRIGISAGSSRFQGRSVLVGWTSEGWNYGYETTDSLQSGQWHHIAITYVNDTIGYDIYLNGIKVNNTSFTYGTGSPDGVGEPHPVWTTDRFLVGMRHNGGEAFSKDGLLDELALFSASLSEDDITNIYNSGVPGTLASFNPTIWWRMGDNDNGTGSIITDQGSGSHDGNISTGGFVYLPRCV